MKHIALIFAGGSGTRMSSGGRPKQFLCLHDKEIIIHTIEQFEFHPRIDHIIVVCIESWIGFLEELIKKYQLKKIVKIVPGGRNGQQSIFNGLKVINDIGEHNSLVLVHDGVRPLVTKDLINENIDVAGKYGAAITVSPAIETIVNLKNEDIVGNIIDRSISFYAKAPQSFKFGDLWTVHNKAIKDGVLDTIDSASLMVQYGYELKVVRCGPENIKITTPSDFYIFRALYEAKENSQIFGI
ncbi:IspD/TarI family cytidylyltransferase [Alkaliflexus imshenetskii]|uniref:IspD/TarI family cytidylyltransferase n=1 Tax=Alkaliflexus imshenetskii TaxID=286730 RepID=UPI00047B6286|nr:IspD/TarI family cytidylyltransferase [Alkaliflexus imshenetskii]